MFLGFGYFCKFAMFYFLVFSSSRKQILKKQPVDQHFVISLFYFYLKQGWSGPQTNKITFCRLTQVLPVLICLILACLRCYPHALIKGILLKIFKIAGSNNFKKVRNTESYFYVLYKNRWKHSQHFKLLFFTINLHLMTLDQIYTYRKLTVPLTNIIYLVFLPLEIQRKLKGIPQVFSLCVKKNDPQTFKSISASKTLFSLVKFYFM